MSVIIDATASARDGPRDLEDAFASRWDTKRAFQDDLRALVQAAASATETAGWWEPGRTIDDAGLVVGVDLHGWGHAEQFGQGLRKLREGKLAPLRPSVFLYSLPSTPASTLGLLFGFGPYQATVNRMGMSGYAALAHAADLLRQGRLERVVVGALTAVDPAVAARLPVTFEPRGSFRLAVAWCLSRSGPGPRLEECEVRVEPREEPTDTTALLPDVPRGYRNLAAPSLLAAARALAAGTRRIVHRGPCFEEEGVLDVSARDGG